ncbi:uncharacterized protein TNCV_3719751 [Trichonephila clavipes]|nr:uncharacterized protein TNCV_3719751 [Trichonephila clavipes]
MLYGRALRHTRSVCDALRHFAPYLLYPCLLFVQTSRMPSSLSQICSIGDKSGDRIEAFNTGCPHTNTIVITAEIESGFVAKDDLVPFRCTVQFPRAWNHSKRRRQWEGNVKGNTLNGRRNPKCPSARRLRMVRKDTGAPSEGATCAWMAADDAVCCMRAFLMI